MKTIKALQLRAIVIKNICKFIYQQAAMMLKVILMFWFLIMKLMLRYESHTMRLTTVQGVKTIKFLKETARLQSLKVLNQASRLIIGTRIITAANLLMFPLRILRQMNCRIMVGIVAKEKVPNRHNLQHRSTHQNLLLLTIGTGIRMAKPRSSSSLKVPAGGLHILILPRCLLRQYRQCQQHQQLHLHPIPH